MSSVFEGAQKEMMGDRAREGAGAVMCGGSASGQQRALDALQAAECSLLELTCGGASWALRVPCWVLKAGGRTRVMGASDTPTKMMSTQHKE